MFSSGLFEEVKGEGVIDDDREIGQSRFLVFFSISIVHAGTRENNPWFVCWVPIPGFTFLPLYR